MTCDFKIEAGSELTVCVLDRGHKGDHSPFKNDRIPEVMSRLRSGQTTEAVQRREEYHVTVGNVDLIDWYNFCHEQSEIAKGHIKPLYIELSNMGRQLMCAMGADPAPNFLDIFSETFPEGKILRVKHETNVMTPDERPVYYECHVKIDGPMLRGFQMASRDLLRVGRWYVTKRSTHPFDGDAFYRQIQKRIEYRSAQKLVGFEYEVCVEDSNPSLDTGWAQ